MNGHRGRDRPKKKVGRRYQDRYEVIQSHWGNGDGQGVVEGNKRIADPI